MYKVITLFQLASWLAEDISCHVSRIVQLCVVPTPVF